MGPSTKDQDGTELVEDISDARFSWASRFWTGSIWLSLPFDAKLTYFCIDDQTSHLASAVFIRPTITTGQGTRILVETATDGLEFHQRVIDHLKRRVDECQHNMNQDELGLLFRHIQLHRSRIGKSGTKPKIESPSDLRKFFQDQADAAQALAQRADSVSKRFFQVKKISQRILADQEELGLDLITSKEGSKKLYIATKCLDTVWADVQLEWRTLKAEFEDFEADQSILEVIDWANPETGELTNATQDEKGSEGLTPSKGSPVAPYAEVDWNDKGKKDKDCPGEGKSAKTQTEVDHLAEALAAALGIDSTSEPNKTAEDKGEAA